MANKKRILILFTKYRFSIRNTVNESIYCFKKHITDTEFYYYNAYFGIPLNFKYLKFDAVILHYTFLAVRFFDNPDIWDFQIKNLNQISGYKIAIPQDEYDDTDKLCNLFKKCSIDTIFTCFNYEDWKKAYPPEKCSIKYFYHVFTGYIDDNVIETFKKKYLSHKNRKIDIAYRARKLPYWFGKHGQNKYEIAEKIKQAVKTLPLNVDISTDSSKVFYGKNWYDFIQDSRIVLGCEGGSSILDSTGEIKSAVIKYMKTKPDASFDEVEKACFSGRDFYINCFALSPRHFECVLTRTCQILLEGNYEGIFKSGIDYIELKKDYSNIKEVLTLARNIDYCEQIAENAYKNIALSGQYTYRKFSHMVFEHINNHITPNELNFLNRIKFILFKIYLSLHEIKITTNFIKLKLMFYIRKPYELKKSSKFQKIKKYILFKFCMK
ncbi:MAG: hypothetical protein ACD_79C00252G0008 [uncultured bacterium]|nr:MAG: hypothetical protein ACD_79C00252G0008 [uncultured bacterium]